MGMKTLAVVALASACLGCQPSVEVPATAPEESVFFLVRHAEKADQSDDPALTEQGHARAGDLARLLKDAGVGQIYSSDFVRTRDTAAPLAAALGLEVALYDPKDLPSLVQTLTSSPGRALVVGHSNTTPELAGLLGGEPGPPIPEDEYDRLYALTHRPAAGTTTVVLRLETPEAPGDTP